jgi:hypothetical protein
VEKTPAFPAVSIKIWTDARAPGFIHRFRLMAILRFIRHHQNLDLHVSTMMIRRRIHFINRRTGIARSTNLIFLVPT